MDNKNQQIISLQQEISSLKKQIATLKKIITLMPGNVYWKDRKGKYLGCNQNLAKILKLKSSEKIIGKTAYELAEPKYADLVEHIDNEIMTADQEKTIEESGPDSFGYPAIYLTKKSPLHDDNGNIIGLLGVSIDVTEQKRIEKELVDLHEKQKDEEIFSLKNIISLMPNNIYWKDRKGNYLGCNQNMATILKLSSPSQIAGKTIYDILDKPSADTINQTDEEAMLLNKEIGLEETGLDIHGNSATYLTRKVPLRNTEGEVIGLAGISLDITQLKKIEEELRIAKEKAEAALQAKEIAEAESREKSKLLKNVLEELQEERYYLSGEYQGIHLTQREAQCLVCLAHGYSIKQIGKKLELSPRTVEAYLNRVKVKLKCNTKTELIAKAIECRFLEGIRPAIPST
jgi:PAS domain S-box-containing protein